VSRRVVLIGGGARSGKSRFALTRAAELGPRLAFVATARAYDDDMAARIARHRVDRPAAFVTYEEPVALAERLLALRDVDAVVVDCLTLWLSNLLLDRLPAEEVERRVTALAEVLPRVVPSVVLVTNEVGMGLHPETELGRLFRDLAGRAHQTLAAVSDEVHLAVLGTVLRLKPGPIEARPTGAPT
jgi:adenosylcobinamide kinase / adenosylcobinamide-phosphate guanylyltransferase